MIELIVIIVTFGLLPLAYLSFAFSPFVVLLSTLRKDSELSKSERVSKAENVAARTRFLRLQSILTISLGVIVLMVTSAWYGTLTFRYGMLIIHTLNVIAYTIMVFAFLIPTTRTDILNTPEYENTNRFIYYWLHFAPATHILFAFWFSYELVLQVVTITASSVTESVL